MAIKTIPAQKIIICDACEKECEGRETKTSAKLVFSQDTLDYTNSPCASNICSLDLCDYCAEIMKENINSTLVFLKNGCRWPK